MIEKESVLYNLSKPIRYSNTSKGDFEESAQIEMLAPSYETAKHTIKLTQYFTRGLMSVRKYSIEKKDDEENKDEEFTVNSLRMTLTASDAPFDKIIDCFEELAPKICFIDSERKVRLNKHLFSTLSYLK